MNTTTIRLANAASDAPESIQKVLDRYPILQQAEGDRAWAEKFLPRTPQRVALADLSTNVFGTIQDLLKSFAKSSTGVDCNSWPIFETTDGGSTWAIVAYMRRNALNYWTLEDWHSPLH